MRKQQRKILRELKTTQKLLNQAQKNADISLSQLKLIKNSIRQRQNLITKYEDQIKIYNSCIEDYSYVITSLDNDLTQAKESYSKFLNKMNLEGSPDQKLITLFTSKDIKDFYMKEGEAAQYQKIQTRKIMFISSLAETISRSKVLMKKNRDEVEQMTHSVSHECKILNNEFVIENSYYQNLKDKERELTAIVSQQKSIATKLQKEVVSEGANKGYNNKTLQKEFEKHKGKLIWPVDGVVIDHFGVHSHTIMKKLKVNNKWITISTLPKTKVKAVYDGVVTAVMAIKHGNLSVFVRHGSYITVYSNLKTVYVKKNQTIKLGKTLGDVYTDSHNGTNTLLKFQIWKMTECLNPEDWLSDQI
ncbi:peptidoglycan DD-metalloendopeptidase family protein [Halosquirtibacter xylanolyticus]|uniref:murein hydrolase activator EnvC family protein n=1 Tax=Halosquirtibacter xylanolyticus TaxID=3374599 RepID=UPI003748D330|nr:peptidoglycan DD-metalloendopeptidase family protein [Prolixibacteraceae bacterium]